MTRMLTPWLTRVPRLPDFETDFPRWMTEVFGPEPGVFGRDGKFLPEANIVGKAFFIWFNFKDLKRLGGFR